MIRFLSVWIFWAAAAAVAAQSMPHVVAGQVQRLPNFQSKFVTARHVDVWLPEGYSTQKRYDVLYMHDGQMLFDSATTWNKQAWDVDDVLTKLAREGRIRDVIVVGIWNGGSTRHSDYFPQKPFESLPQAQRDSILAADRPSGSSVFGGLPIRSDDYLRFLVYELKPFIDSAFSTRPERRHTFVAGSSMGGLISMYAICEYPRVFGGAACLSTHWPGLFTTVNNPIPDAFVAYLREHLPSSRTHKLYFDFGDQTLDAMYPPLQKKADAVIHAKPHPNKVTVFFPGDDHSEASWKRRFHEPALFLLGQ